MEIEQLTAEERSLLDSMRDAIVALEEEQAIAAAEKAVAKGIDPKIAIRYAVADAAITVGEKFDQCEYFLPQLVISGDIMDAVTKILEKNIPVAETEKKKVIVIGTVQADVHGHGALGSRPEASVGVDGSHLGSPVAEVDGEDPGHVRPAVQRNRAPWSAWRQAPHP